MIELRYKACFFHAVVQNNQWLETSNTAPEPSQGCKPPLKSLDRWSHNLEFGCEKMSTKSKIVSVNYWRVLWWGEKTFYKTTWSIQEFLMLFWYQMAEEREREKEKKHVTRNPGLPALESLSLVEVTHWLGRNPLRASFWYFSWNTLRESPWWKFYHAISSQERGFGNLHQSSGCSERKQSLGYVAHFETRYAHNFPFTSRSSYWPTTPLEHGLLVCSFPAYATNLWFKQYPHKWRLAEQVWTECHSWPLRKPNWRRFFRSIFL